MFLVPIMCQILTYSQYLVNTHNSEAEVQITQIVHDRGSVLTQVFLTSRPCPLPMLWPSLTKSLSKI